MTTTTSRKPDYDKLEKLAYDFLVTYSDGQLPVNLVHIIQQLDDIHLMKYTTFAEKYNLSLGEVTVLLQSDDGALWYQEASKTYLLLYNDTVSQKERIRFTIAHELGHYVLKHNELTEKTIVSRYVLAESEYAFFEQEANFFAKHLLVPFPVLMKYSRLLDGVNLEFIRERFQVSYSVAEFVINNLRKMYFYNIPKLIHSVEETFTPYIFKDNQKKICQICTAQINRQDLFCSTCSAKQHQQEWRLEEYIMNKNKERFDRMKYSNIKLDSNGFPVTCPRCDNEEIEQQKYCLVCGLFLQNICLGVTAERTDAFGHENAISTFLTSGCAIVLSGHARYCHDCGGLSSYYFQEILEDWEIEKAKKLKIAN